MWRVIAPMVSERPLELDAGQALDQRQVDQIAAGRRGAASSSAAASGRRREAWRPRSWPSRLAACRSVSRTMEGEAVHRSSPFISRLTPRAAAIGSISAAPPTPPAASPAWRCASVPIASVMALITAAGAAMAPASPQPLMPSGLDGHFVIVVSDLQRRQVVGARHGVIHERAGHELAFLVVDRALAQRLADALRDAAVDLALDDHRIDHHAEIVDRSPGDDLGVAGLRVDLDLADVAAGREGEIGRVVERALLQPGLELAGRRICARYRR